MLFRSVYSKGGNRWEVKIDSKNIPLNLLPPQIELPVKFVTKNDITSGDLVLFEINLNVNGAINSTKPLIGIQKLDEKINDYFDVINILQSIQTPIPRTVFTELRTEGGNIGFGISNKFYYLESLNSPLKVLSI